MIDALSKAFAFVFIIALGYLLKQKGFFAPKDYRILAKISINITLPAAVITSFSKFRVDASLLFIIVLALLCNLILLFVGYLYTRKRDDRAKILYMMMCPGYNIGAFATPYIQNFLGPFGVVVSCMFDTGNSIMVAGGTYAIMGSTLSTGGKFTLKSMVKRLLSSMAFCTYAAMLIISMVGLTLPSPLITVTSIIGQANGFIAMLMIGIMIELKFDRGHMKDVGKILLTRYAFAVIASVLLFFFTPFPLELRQVLAVLVFAPTSNLAQIFTDKCGGDVGISSFVASISILISVFMMTLLMVIIGAA